MVLQSTQPPTEMSTRNIFQGKGGRCLGLTTFMCRLSWNLEAPTSWNPLELYCCIVMPACTVLLFYRNPFIDLYCHMFIATLAFVTYVKVVVLSILYTPACRKISAAWGKKLNPFSDQRSLDPSGRSSSLWGKTSQDHLASPVAAVVPNWSTLLVCNYYLSVKSIYWSLSKYTS